MKSHDNLIEHFDDCITRFLFEFATYARLFLHAFQCWWRIGSARNNNDYCSLGALELLQDRQWINSSDTSTQHCLWHCTDDFCSH